MLPGRRAGLVLLAALLCLPAAQAARVPITIEAGSNPDGSMYFRPDHFTVNQGDEVVLTVHNADTIFHDVAVLDYAGRDIENELDPGETAAKNFTASVPGNFRFICEVSGHAGLGMQGNFTVQAASTGPKGAPGFEPLLAAGAVVGAALLAMRRRPPRRAPLLGALVVGALLLAGCTSPNPPPAGARDGEGQVGTPTGTAYEASFEGSAEGAAPTGWQVAQGTWAVVEDDTSPAGSKVLRATHPTEGFPLIVAPTGTYGNFDASLQFKVEGGNDSQSAGIAFHHKDSGNYNVVRVNLLEGNARLFTYVDGNRKSVQPDGAVNASLGAWHTLALKVRGEEVVVTVDGVRIFEAETAANPIGGVGLWTKDDSTTLFDDLNVRPS